MATTVAQSQIQSWTINIPKVDLKRLKGIAKAMGWTLEKPEPKTLGDLSDKECWEYLCKTRPEGFELLSEEEEKEFEEWLAKQ